MQTVVRLPNIREVADPIVGAPYEQYACWALVRYLFKEGLDLDIIADPQRAAEQLYEVWFDGDPRDPVMLVQPWDLFIMVKSGLVSEHVGLVLDETQIVHTRRSTGVVIEPLPRLRPKLLQLGRLRMLA